MCGSYQICAGLPRRASRVPGSRWERNGLIGARYQARAELEREQYNLQQNSVSEPLHQFTDRRAQQDKHTNIISFIK